MRIRPLVTALTAFVLISTLGGLAAADGQHVIVPAENVKWMPAPPAFPPGAQMSVLEGDPGQKGTITVRLKFPANYEIPAHWHSMTERVTVLSGTLQVGMGDKLDRGRSQALHAGGYVSLPSRMHHFAWAPSPTVVQINLEGPFDIFYVNPADDPQQAKHTR